MKLIADLQIHSRFSRATGRDINIANLEKYARLKGIDLLGTGDITHPEWLKELKNELTEDGSGILKSKSGFNFVLQGEISNIYSQGGKGRRVHNVLLAKNFEVAEQIQAALKKKGRIDYDGRPIFGFSCIELVEMLKNIDEKIEIIPAHCLLPGTIIHSNPNLKAIESFKKNDRVLTHKGNYRKVKEIYSRPYKGYVYHIKPRYFTLGLTTTEEHPFYAIKTLKNCSWTSGICKPTHPHIKRCVTKAHRRYKPQWILAKNLEIGDVILYPRLKNIKDAKLLKIGKDDVNVDKDFCRLVGYYLAEGYSNGRDGIGFAFNKNEEKFVNDVKNLISKIFNVNIKEGKTKGDIIVYSNSLRRFFEKNFYSNDKKRAYSKCMPSWMLYFPLEKQVEIFKGWWYGDKGSTSSRLLMNQFKIICLRLGIIPSIFVDSREMHKLRGKHVLKGRTIEARYDNYILNRLTFFEDKFDLLKDDFFKDFKRDKFKYGWMDDNYAYLPILKMNKSYYEGKVYNLEVEKDNSYVSEFAVIHNCWTPWFSLFGSMSGFDSVKECFKDQTKHIHAIETGMSSDPAMNWRLSQLDDFTLVSSSDAHSYWPWRMGREANVFDIDMNYDSVIKAIRDKKGFLYTIETNPEYGKYHVDGHRACDVSFEPHESKKHNNICPKCKKPLTIGVLHRVEELADRPHGFIPKNAIPFRSVIPLAEILSFLLGVSVASKKVWQEYFRLVNHFGSEFNVLFDAKKEEMAKVVDGKVADAIIAVRENKVEIKPGYDGVYGQLVFDKNELKNIERGKKITPQKSLSEF